jgi:hypothetical protein
MLVFAYIFSLLESKITTAIGHGFGVPDSQVCIEMTEDEPNACFGKHEVHIQLFIVCTHFYDTASLC